MTSLGASPDPALRDPPHAAREGVTTPKETKRRFRYEPHEWQPQTALKVLEGNVEPSLLGPGKGKRWSLPSPGWQ